MSSKFITFGSICPGENFGNSFVITGNSITTNDVIDIEFNMLINDTLATCGIKHSAGASTFTYKINSSSYTSSSLSTLDSTMTFSFKSIFLGFTNESVGVDKIKVQVNNDQRLFTILKSIVGLMHSAYQKIKRLDRYWSTQYSLDVAFASGGDGHDYTVTLSSDGCWLMQNTLQLGLVCKPPSNLSAGANENYVVAKLTFTSPSSDPNIIAKCIPPNEAPIRTEAVSGTTGAPLVNYTLTSWSRTGPNTITADLCVGSIIGAQLTSSTGSSVRFFCPVTRLLP